MRREVERYVHACAVSDPPNYPRNQVLLYPALWMSTHRCREVDIPEIT